MGRSLGTYLRELRAARGVSLDEVARATRVSRRFIEALESDTLGDLPAPVFTKGYIRAYCQILGEPPDEALARYRELAGETQDAAPPVRPHRPVNWREHSLLVSMVLVIVFGAGLLAFTLSLQSGPSKPEEPPAAPIPPTAVPAAGAIPLPRVPPTPPEPGLARLVARASELTWIRVETADGRLAEETLPPGATREWVSPNRFILTIGNAGGLALELNGRPLPPLGGSGTVIRKLVLPEEAPDPKP